MNRVSGFIASLVLLPVCVHAAEPAKPTPGVSIRVLLVGKTSMVIEDARQRLEVPGVDFATATSLADVRSALTSSRVDTLIMGAGLDIETRLQIIRAVYELSETTSVHLKDASSGPQGFLPFAKRMIEAERASRIPSRPASPRPSP